jgi:hypothetical protein
MATQDTLPAVTAALRTTRIQPRRHATALRGSPESVPSSSTETGLFGRMFRNLPVFSHKREDLITLGAKMVSEAEDEPTPEGEVDPEETTKPIPAGYTYLGQFIDHDLTFDPVSMLPDVDLTVGGGDEVPTPITQITDDFAGNAPLWYYVLREAELEHEGNQLGPVGGRIVAEVFVGLLGADRLSYLNVEPGGRRMLTWAVRSSGCRS